jgi:hypothetical protein
MQKVLMGVMVVVLWVGIVFGQPYTMATSSGEKTEDTQVMTGIGAITSVQLITDGTNAATLTVHDGTSNADKKLGEYKCDGSSYYCGWTWNFPAQVGTGIYCDVTGTGASYIIDYIKR